MVNNSLYKKRYPYIILSEFVPVILFFCLFIQSAEAQSGVRQPRLNADPEIISLSQNLNLSDWHSLFLTAYCLSGASGGEDVLHSFIPVAEKLSAITVHMDERRKAESVLQFMHGQILHKYVEQQTGIDVLLATGQYNCVSSAVLYTILGTAVGLDVEGVQTSDHAFCSVKIGNSLADVETTNMYGFDPGSRKDFHDYFGKITGFAYVPPGNYHDRTAINRKVLFSLIISNRIAQMERSGHYDDAVGLSIDRWVFLGNDSTSAFNEAVGEMVNYGAQLVKTGNEEQALVWSDEIIRNYGPYPRQTEFISYAVSSLIAKLLRQNKIGTARFRLESLRPQLDTTTAENLAAAVSDAELVAALNKVEKDNNEAVFLHTLNDARLTGTIPEKRIRDIEIAWYLYRIDYIAHADGWKAAYIAAVRILMTAGIDSRLENARIVCRSNYITDLYNEAAAAYNNGQYNKAHAVTESAIAEFPEVQAFQTLMENIKQALDKDSIQR
jgi:hypothetical protein